MDPSLVSKGNEVFCILNALDRSNAATEQLTSVVVENSLPLLEAAGITPEAPASNETLLCSASVSDLDGDSVLFHYEWSINGTTTETTAAATATLGITQASCAALPPR